MELKDIRAYLETNKDNEEVRAYLGELSKVTLEGVEEFLNTDDGRKYLQPKLDKNFTKGLETWKSNNLQKLIDDAVVKANPEETPEQKQIRELTERLNKKEAEEKRQTLLNKAYKIADEKKLPKDILDNFLGEDEESTIKNLESLQSVFSSHVETLVNERLKSGNYTPPKGGSSDETKTVQETFKNSLNQGF